MTRRKKTAAPKKPRKSAARRSDPRRAIDACALIDALEQHVLGTKKMTATQVNAALALLKKFCRIYPHKSLHRTAPTKKPRRRMKTPCARLNSP